MDRRVFLETAAGACAVAAAGSLTTPAISQRAAARTLRFVPQVSNFDPIWGTTHVVRNGAAMVWDMLYGVDDKLRPRRQIVEAEEVSADGLTWTFRRRAGLTGDELTLGEVERIAI
jgi:peptide/nickel transport system substrate-binding protein